MGNGGTTGNDGGGGSGSGGDGCRLGIKEIFIRGFLLIFIRVVGVDEADGMMTCRLVLSELDSRFSPEMNDDGRRR